MALKSGRVLLAVSLLLFAAVAMVAAPHLPLPQKKNQDLQSRTLLGAVMNKGDQPLEKAIVYLKNDRNQNVQSFITAADGKYRFHALSLNTDYDVFAEYNGKRSATRTLSSFDSRTEVYLDLRIDVAK